MAPINVPYMSQIDLFENYFRKLGCTSRPFKPENISTKLGVSSYGKAKIQTFIIKWSARGTVTHNNRYALLIVTPADWHEYFQLKFVFAEHIYKLTRKLIYEVYIGFFGYNVYCWFGLVWFNFIVYQLLLVIFWQIHFYAYKQFYFKQFSQHTKQFHSKQLILS